MKLHGNAALSLNQRRRMVRRVVEEGWSLTKAAEAAEVSERTCSKWVGRYRAEGEPGLLDRSSAPASIPHRTPEERVEVIAVLRRLRMTGAEIAFCLAMPLSTVAAVLQRIGLGRLSRLEPPEPPNRYERRHPGELVHVDVKKLGRIPTGRAGHRVHGNRRLQRSRRRDGKRIVGWECVHVCVDDATRLAYVEVHPDEKATTAVAFLRRAVAFYAAHGITVQRVMTDNGPAYRSTIHAFACRALALRHLRTRPYRPRTNGKAERFIRTLLTGWAYGAIYGSSHERAAALDGWLWAYNHRRPHGALSHKPPIARLNELNNLPGSYRRPGGPGPAARAATIHTVQDGFRIPAHMPSELIDICTLSELPPGTARMVEWEDLEIGVFNCNGEILAIEDRCSHDNGPLAEGDFDAETCTVECPRHGSLFDLHTGKPTTLPAYVPVDTFPVVVEGDLVKVEVE